MAVLHWYCQYIANVLDADKHDGLDGYKFAFTEEIVNDIFTTTTYGNSEEEVEQNNEAINLAEQRLELYSEGWVDFDENEEIYIFPLMNDEEIEQVNAGELNMGTRLVSIGVVYELDGYDPYEAEPERRANVQYLNFGWSYEGLNDGDGSFEESETYENDVEMSQAAPIPAPASWAWCVYCDFLVSGTTASLQPVYYPLSGYTIYGFSGANQAAISTILSACVPYHQYNVLCPPYYDTVLSFENRVSAITSSYDPNHTWQPMDFWTLTSNGTYSAETTEMFYYSASCVGHKTGMFRGFYSIYAVCLTDLYGNQQYSMSHLYNHSNPVQNKAILEANVFTIYTLEEFDDDTVSHVDVGLGHAGSAITGRYGYVRVISSAETFSHEMPCFISRIGSPGEFLTVYPNNVCEAYIQTTGEIASKQRAKQLWALFDESSELNDNGLTLALNDKMGFTPRQVINNTETLNDNLLFSIGSQQNYNRLFLTSELLNYGNTPNYYVDEKLSTTWNYLNYITSGYEAYSSGGGEHLIGQIELSANTKYVVCLPMFSAPLPTYFNFIARIGNNNISCNLLHFYRGPHWNKNMGCYVVNEIESGQNISVGALLIKTPNNYHGIFNVFINVTYCVDVNDGSGTKIYLPRQQTLFYFPILKDNYLDTNGPRPVDVADM